MKSEILTKEAYKALKKNSYSVTIQLLEKNINVSNNPYDFFLLILAYLFADRLMNAETTLRKALNQYPGYTPLLEIKAFLLLKSAKNKDEASSGYIEIIKISPRNRKIIKILSKIQNAVDIEQYQKQARIKDFIEIKPPKAVKTMSRSGRTAGRKAAAVIIFSVIVMVLIAGIVFFPSSLAQLIKEKAEMLFSGRPQLLTLEEYQNISIDAMHYDIIDTMQNIRTPEFYSTNEACIRDFNKAKTLMKQGQDNEAMMLLNKIDASNAQMRVKERVAFLKDVIIRNQDRTIAHYAYSDVVKKPYLYKHINVSWEGKIANLKQRDDSFVFQMLVNYSNDRFDGIAEVFARTQLGLANGIFVKVEGTITNIIGQKIIILEARRVEIQEQ